MSYILDALKKVEHEKAIKAKSGGVTSISGDLFQERTPRSSRSGAGKIIAATVFVSLLTFAVAWFMFNGAKKKTSILPSSATNATEVQPKRPEPPAAATVAAPPPQQTPAPATPSAPATASAPKPQKTYLQTIPAPADIKVSGIAWQEERAARRVVINGLLLQEGAAVSGAKILEIHQDTVRFSSPAGVFDVRMDVSTLQGTPK